MIDKRELVEEKYLARGLICPEFEDIEVDLSNDSDEIDSCASQGGVPTKDINYIVIPEDKVKIVQRRE